MTSRSILLKLQSRSYPLVVISLCAAFLFYKYILQNYPSIMTFPLMAEFNLTGAGLGNLAAMFFYTYVITQFFVGVLIDKYSIRWLTASAILGCSIGMLLFAETHSLWAATLARAIMGVGVAFATIAYMKSAAVWFPPKHYAFVSGLLGSAAMAGAVFGQAPLAFLVNTLGWRQCLFTVGFAGIALSALFIFIVRDHSKQEVIHHPISLKDIKCLVKNKQNWLLTLYSGLAFSPLAIFGGLWGNPFLQLAYQLSGEQTATMISLSFIGFGIGCPILGTISDRLQNRRHVMFVGTLMSAIALTLVLYCHPMPAWLLSTLLFTFGFGLGAFMLVFAIGKEVNSIALTATITAMINSGDAVLDALTEPAIGKFLDLQWNGTLTNGAPVFSLHSYHTALSTLPIYLLVATILLLWIKEAPEKQ